LDEQVSVVIPIYNAADYLEACLNAVCAQSHSKVEIILVNDGSTDGTQAIIDRYSRYDARVKAIETENHGVSEARNTGIENAGGKYITFIDADDIPNMDLIEKYVEAKNGFGNEAALVLTGMNWYNARNKGKKYENHILAEADGYEMGKRYLLGKNKTHYLVWLMLFNFVTNKMYDLEAIKRNGIRFRRDIKNGEDLTFNLDYMKKVPGGYGVINEPLYRYIRRTEASLSLSYYEGCIEHTRAIYQDLYDFVSAQEGCTEDDKLVIAATGFTDWVSRLTALYYCKDCGQNCRLRYRRIRKEVNSPEFKRILEEIFKAGKISKIRYKTLKTGDFRLFIILRWFYRIFK
jgi:glycosyltransferase involved in cell wall biosynthesis